jgi:hypothetical protein
MFALFSAVGRLRRALRALRVAQFIEVAPVGTTRRDFSEVACGLVVIKSDRGNYWLPRLTTCTRRLRGSGVWSGVGISRPSLPIPIASTRLRSTRKLVAR